jgi:hypothetical protein
MARSLDWARAVGPCVTYLEAVRARRVTALHAAGGGARFDAGHLLHPAAAAAAAAVNTVPAKPAKQGERSWGWGLGRR